MNWVAITLIVILALTTVGGGVFSWLQTDSLGEAEDEIDILERDVATLEANVSSLEGNVSTLEGDVSTLEGNVATLETNLSESEATVATLQTDLEDANTTIGNLQEDLSTQRTINSTLSEELKTVKDPRHFESIQELTDWLEQDDTDTEYEDDSELQRAFILLVRAIRDGYVIGVDAYWDNGTAHAICWAIIGDVAYVIHTDTDETERGRVVQPLPSHPEPLD